jgi:hypothetical protein
VFSVGPFRDLALRRTDWHGTASRKITVNVVIGRVGACAKARSITALSDFLKRQ